jgi:hypothetical protein
MLSVVTFKWSTPGYRAEFTPEHVHILRDMVARHYKKPHRFICITDDPTGLECETIPLWDDHREVPNPTGGGRPSCYLRLKLFSKQMKKLVGKRHVMLDLDCVITGDLEPIFDRPEDIVIFQNPQRFWPYNGGLWLQNTGCRDKVWKDFDPIESPRLTHEIGYRGSDQAWMSYKIPGEAMFNETNGVYWFAHLRPKAILPEDARIVLFTADTGPWMHKERIKWIFKHYRKTEPQFDFRVLIGGEHLGNKCKAGDILRGTMADFRILLKHNMVMKIDNDHNANC